MNKKNQEGVALVIVLLGLFTLSLVGMTAIKTTVTDIQISGNIKEIKEAHFIAEAGMSHSVEYIKKHLSNWDTTYNSSTPVTLLSSTTFGSGSYSSTIETAGGERRRNHHHRFRMQ